MNATDNFSASLDSLSSQREALKDSGKLSLSEGSHLFLEQCFEAKSWQSYGDGPF